MKLQPALRVSAVMAACLGAGCAHAPQLAEARVPPLGVLETPCENERIDGQIKVTGWAGDDVGIRMVRVLLDGMIVALASFTVNRPDVSDVYPQLRHGT